MIRKQITVPGFLSTALLTMLGACALALPGAGWASAAAAPVITGFAPHHGLVGEKVTIYGHNLTGAQVQFNGFTADDASVNPAGTQITVTVPPETTTGPTPIIVITPGGTVQAATNFRVNPASAHVAAPKPADLRITPLHGHAGTKVTISGKNLGGALAVKFGGVKALYTVPAETKIVATVPKAARSGTIAVTTSAGSAITSMRFVVTAK